VLPISEVIQLRAAEGIPTPPDALGESGLKVWNQAWIGGAVWISPDSDVMALERVCKLADAVDFAFKIFSVSGDGNAGRLYVQLTHEFGLALSAMGFDPVSRTRMGVAEVTAKSKLEQLQRTKVVE
jgi:hypothetical protein